MSPGSSFWEPGRRAAACLAIVLAASLATAATAAADTTFGGNPNQEVTPELASDISCAPFTCTLYWAGPGGSDLAPIPASGGAGTVTSVTLPPLLNPGTMQAVVLTSKVQGTKDPAHPSTTCCTVKELSAPFTVPSNQVTTVPLSLHVSATPAANLGVPGDTSTADGVGISVITAEASAPLHATENPADIVSLWAPALTAPSTTAQAPFDERPGYELAARFTYAETPGARPPSPGGPGSPGAGAAATSGLTLHRGILRPGRDGRTLVFGTATDPPTASTRQTLSLPRAGASAANGKRGSTIIGRGRTKVPAGGSAPLKLTLNSKGRAALAAGRPLKAKLSVVATNPGGELRTLTRRVKIAPARTKRPR